MMYCYILTHWNYEDSMLLPVFHEKKYSMEEFDKICQEAREKSIRLNPYTDTIECTIYDLYHALIEEYGFKSLNDKVLSFNVNENMVTLLKDDNELDILLNMSPF
ncbi:hypothetical protein [uncultured Methanobrevibacter sp.]|uniref:hypothetical protein n=1 Tax=uncultured Methanobrevibacter sp. TaxID=253161 RepID=UPI00263687E4|nr:hypothetical protein [uncultured Methanobrevibacter sp.]